MTEVLQVTFEELIAGDHYIDATLLDNNKIDIDIKDDDYKLVDTQWATKNGWDSLVYFAEQIIRANKRIQRQMEDKQCV